MEINARGPSGPCALCLEPDVLQRSHIIPEFLYEPLYDEKHRYNVLSIRPGEPNRIEQKGARERLLCLTCERRLNGYETYASLVIKGGASGISYRREDTIIFLRGIDYAKFKLFQLSILWRAGVSSLPFFERVQLGPHQEYLRKMVLTGDPGRSVEYPSIMWGVTLTPGETPGMLMQPLRKALLGHQSYLFAFSGLVSAFIVSKRPLQPPYDRFVLQEDGSLIMQVKPVTELPPLRMFMEEFEKQGRVPRLICS